MPAVPTYTCEHCGKDDLVAEEKPNRYGTKVRRVRHRCPDGHLMDRFYANGGARTPLELLEGEIQDALTGLFAVVNEG